MMLHGRFFSVNTRNRGCAEKCGKIFLQVYPCNWRNRLVLKCPIFRTFCPKRVVGWLSRGARDTSYAGSFGKRCFTVFFGIYWGCTVHSILNGFRTRISQKLSRKLEYRYAWYIEVFYWMKVSFIMKYTFYHRESLIERYYYLLTLTTFTESTYIHVYTMLPVHL